MPHIPVLKYVSSVTSFSILFMVVLFLETSSRSSSPPATTTIDFETLNAPGSGTGGLEVRNQFAANGIIFQPVTALDYSQGIPIPNFAHSGTKAVELCYGVEFCTGKLDLSFTAPQRRVKLWTGYGFRLDTAQAVVMRAFDGSGNEVASDVKILGPSTSVIPISTPMEVTLPSATVVRVTVGFSGAESSIPQIFNNSLAFDDIEFDDQGTAPACPATQPPVLTVNEPTEGRIVIQNAFTLDANFTTPDPFATLQIDVTGPTAATRTFGPFFVSSGRIQIFNITSLLFPGRNTVVFVARDCAGSRQVTRTVFFRNDVTRTPIRVINDSGANVPNAEVYANGNLLGYTDSAGLLIATPALNSGTALVARKFITESSTYRDNHAQGSFQDWKFRVYISSIAVDNAGSLISNTVNLEPDPLAPQVLRVLRRNTLIGLHVVASIEWDASLAEMEVVKQKLIGASKFLYTATDGQILIEQAEVVDDAKYWEDADYRVYANQSLRAYVDDPRGGFFDDSFWSNGSWIHVQINDDAPTYAHEFGHYGFDVGDEYQDNTPSVQCTFLLSVGSIPPGANRFQSGSPSASCMMFNQWGAPKLCSGRPENPHVRGTRQGNSSCWSTLSGHYSDSNDTPRWILQTPDTRGAIPGPVNGGYPPLNAWVPRIIFENGLRPNLCGPIPFAATRSDGTPQTNREIWLETTYGADILEGKTDANGQLTATGLHVGDDVDGFTIQPVNCAPVARLRPSPIITPAVASMVPTLSTSPVTFSQQRERPPVQKLEIAAPAFNVFTVLKPTRREGADITVRVEAPSGKEIVQLAKPPAVKVRMRGQETRSLLLHYSEETGGYVGAIARLPVDTELEIEVAATDRKGQTVHTVGRFQMSRPDPDYETDVMSSDGQISLTIPAKALPAGARVAIGPSSAALPALPEGYSVVAGPFSVWSFPDNQLYQPGTLRFQLPHQRQDSGATGYLAKTFRIFHYDPKSQKWEDLGGIVHPHPIDIVTVETNRLGLFALVGRKTGKEYPQSALSVDTFTSDTRSRFADLLSMVLELR